MAADPDLVPPMPEPKNSTGLLVAATVVGALFGFVASYIALVLGVHAGPAEPAAIIDGPLILLYPHDDLGYVATVLGGGTLLYGIYGYLLSRPPRFLGRFGVAGVILLIHAASAALILHQ